MPTGIREGEIRKSKKSVISADSALWLSVERCLNTVFKNCKHTFHTYISAAGLNFIIYYTCTNIA